MALVEVGDVYINVKYLRGVSDVATIPPPSEGVPPSYSVNVYLEGSTTAVTTKTEAEANKLHDKVVKKLPPQFTTSTGRATFVYTAVNSIGPVGDDPIEGDQFEAAFSIGMDGASVVLQYVDFAAAEKARKNLAKQIDKS